ncbi:MAG TPA: hypothetical protein VNI57_07675 [Candidatus Saccharimonadales bacterium]|nr:hypothetical protein [Candidatus Saccharimonadales bacterium]
MNLKGVGILATAGVLALLPAGLAHAGACNKSAALNRSICQKQVLTDFQVAMGKCANVTAGDQKACRDEARTERNDSMGDCADIGSAYHDACGLLGDVAYDPAIDPNDFSTTIDNPYYPLVPGTTFVYEAQTADGLEHNEVAVTGDTETLMGVPCVVVHDTVALDGVLTEDTYDYYAQDSAGNVWYFGEYSYTLENGRIVDIAGSWRAGVDGAKPGIIMEANPMVGDVYRQEFFFSEAEDMAQVLDLAGSETVPYQPFSGALVTRAFTPLEPDGDEHKFYLPGTGLMLEVDQQTGDRNELIDIKHN